MSKLDSKKKTLIIVGVVTGVMALLAAGVHFLKSIAEEFEGDDDYYGYGDGCCDDCGVCDGSCADGPGSGGSADPVEPPEPAAPAGPAESVEPAEPSAPAEPAEPGEPE